MARDNSVARFGLNLAFSELLPPGATPLTSGGDGAAPLSKRVTMRIASFNVENMFRRAVALNFATWKDGKVILEQYALVNSLLEEPVYTVSIKKSIVDALEKLGLKKSSESQFVILRENHGHLLKRPKPDRCRSLPMAAVTLLAGSNLKPKRLTRSRPG